MLDSNVRVKKTCRGHVFSGRGLMNASARTEPNRRAGRYRKMNTSILQQNISAFYPEALSLFMRRKFWQRVYPKISAVLLLTGLPIFYSACNASAIRRIPKRNPMMKFSHSFRQEWRRRSKLYWEDRENPHKHWGYAGFVGWLRWNLSVYQLFVGVWAIKGW